ncbi:MAG: hypothetical protein ACRYFX_03820 [Janthinobacterium lividum]
MRKAKTIEALLRKALVANGPMSLGLYEYELQEHLDYWREGMRRDKDEMLLVVTEMQGGVAMLLLDNKGQLFINEVARQELQRYWSHPGAYAHNMQLLLPQMAQQLAAGAIWVSGMKTQPQYSWLS